MGIVIDTSCLLSETNDLLNQLSMLRRILFSLGALGLLLLNTASNIIAFILILSLFVWEWRRRNVANPQFGVEVEPPPL